MKAKDSWMGEFLKAKQNNYTEQNKKKLRKERFFVLLYMIIKPYT